MVSDTFSKKFHWWMTDRSSVDYWNMYMMSKDNKGRGSKVQKLPDSLHDSSIKCKWDRMVKARRAYVPYDPLARQEDYYFPNYKMSGPYRNRNKV